jgi:anti-sigma regulatory factor (Ser/Thr protein kinase)
VLSSRPPFLHRFAPHVAELPVARRAFRHWLTSDQPVDEDALQELLVIATELCTSALHHAAAGLITLRAWQEDDSVVVEVEGADRPAESSVVRMLDPWADEAGRGMLIVESLCDDVSVVVRDRSRYVRCHKRLATAS